MRKTALCVATLLALFASSVAFGQSAGERTTDPAEWVPADAVLYFGITDIGRTWSDYKKTGSYKFMQDASATEALPEFDIFSTAITKLQQRIAASLDVGPDQLQNPLDGAFAVYVAITPGSKPDDVQLGVISGIGDAALLKQYYTTAVAKLEKATKHETQTAGAYTIDVFTKQDDGGAEDNSSDEFDPEGGLPPGSPTEMLDTLLDDMFSADSLPESLAMCLTDDRFIAGSSADVVKAALQPGGRGKTLADTEDHKALLQHLKPVGTIHVLLNVPRLVESMKADVTGDDADEMQKWFKALGVDGLRSLVGHMRVGAASYNKKVDFLLLMDTNRTGLAKVLSMPNRPIAPPPSVPADTSVYAFVNLNVPSLLDDILRMLRDSDPEAAQQMEQSLGAVPLGDQPINLRKDLLDHLTGPFSFCLGFDKPIGPGTSRVLLSMGQRDQAAVTRMLGNFPMMLQPREVRGTQVFDAMMAPGVSLAVTPQAVVAGNAAAIEGALDAAPAAEPLADSEAWRRTSRHVPDEAWFAVYADSHSMLEAALAYAKDGGASIMGPNGMDVGAMFLQQMFGTMMQGMDADDAMKARKLLRYTGTGIFTFSTTEHGIRITQVDLPPKE